MRYQQVIDIVTHRFGKYIQKTHTRSDDDSFCGSCEALTMKGTAQSDNKG